MARTPIPVSLSALTLESLAAFFPRPRLDQGRDYWSGERVCHRIATRHGLACRLQGYQGYYIPAVQTVRQGLMPRCDCDRPQPCAHVAGLLWAWVMDPEGFADGERVVFSAVPTARDYWPWLSHTPFPWERIPESAPPWLKPPQGSSLAPPWSTEPPPDAYRWLRQWASLVHPGYWADADWQKALWETLEATAGRMGQDAADWLAIAWHSPEIPLEPLWPRLAPALAPMRPLLLGWLAQAALSDPALAVPRAAAMLAAAEAAFAPPTGGLSREVLALYRLYRWADPGCLRQARYWATHGRRRAAIRLLERQLSHWPPLRAEIRAQLIAWTEGEEQLGHLVADALEHPAAHKWAAIAARLGPERWQALRDQLDAAHREEIGSWDALLPKEGAKSSPAPE